MGNAGLLPRQRTRRRLSDDSAAVLLAARRRRGMSLRAVANEAELSPSYISRCERGHRAPRRPAAVRLIRALHLDYSHAEALLAEVAP